MDKAKTRLSIQDKDVDDGADLFAPDHFDEAISGTESGDISESESSDNEPEGVLVSTQNVTQG